jgi:hypothetical protein
VSPGASTTAVPATGRAAHEDRRAVAVPRRGNRSSISAR